MRELLFLCHRFPYPPNKGEKIRAWNILTHLASRWRVRLGCLSDNPADLDHLPQVQAVCEEVAVFHIRAAAQKRRALARVRPGRPLMLDYYGHAGLRAWVNATLATRHIDLTYTYSTAMAQYIPHRHDPHRMAVLDMVDIDSEKWAAYATESAWPMRLVWAREGRTLLRYEAAATLASDLALLVSEAECHRFATLAPQTAGRVHALQNGVDLTRFAPDLGLPSPFSEPGPHLVFTGHMDYWPNADAAIWFAREMMPLLRQRHPTAVFTVVGANPGPSVTALADLPGVRVTGQVEDVRPYVAHAEVAVAPLRIARGIQNKVLEAMAMGRPVVASPQAFEGVSAVAGRDLLVADGVEATVAAIGEVLDRQHVGIGREARAAMEASYDWRSVFTRLDALMDDARPVSRPAAAARSAAR